jgi:muramoyltetrapeptide carboxypeptidase
MLTPTPIKEGDSVAVVAPARSISKREVEPAIEMIKKWGLKVHTGEHLFSTDNQFAGSDRKRAGDLQKMLDDKHIRAIFCARGGYGTVRTLQHLNFDRFVHYPKWIVGFSDITVLHSYIYEKLGIKTLHAPMPVNFPENMQENQSIWFMKKVLFGEDLSYSWSTSYDNPRKIKISGMLIGGNLSVLYSLSGTRYDINTANKILFLEDLDEYLYHIDRMMMNLKLSGKLEEIKGLLIGGMTGMQDNSIPFGKTAYEIVADVAGDYGFPIFFDCPSGHTETNHPLIMGGTLSLCKEGRKIAIEYID